MGESAYDTKIAAEFREAFCGALNRGDLKALLAMVHEDGQRWASGYFGTYVKARCTAAKSRIIPFVEPDWHDAAFGLLETHEYFPPPVCTLLLTVKNRIRDQRQFLPLGPDGKGGYCMCCLRERGRKGPTLPEEFDLDVFRKDVREAARACFTRLRRKNPRERFCGYALYSDDSAMSIVPAADTESRLASAAQAASVTCEKDINDIRWFTPDWAFEAAEADEFNAISQRLGAASLGDIPVKGGRARFGKRVFDAAVAALKDLEKEGLFGRGKPRQDVLVFFTISDSDSARKIEKESARQLNPAPVCKRFLGG